MSPSQDVIRGNRARSVPGMGDPNEAPDARRRKVYMLAKRLSMGRQDRLAFAEVLLWKDVPSWSELDDGDIGRLLDAFEGYALVKVLLEQRQPYTETTAS